MTTRITIDLGDPQLLTQLRMESARQNKTLREIVVSALTGYFSHNMENRAVLKLAEKNFEEWDNPIDSEYDNL